MTGLALVLSFLAIIPAVHADELADLRANSEVLRQRLDQIQGQAAASKASGDPTGSADGAGGDFPRSFAIPGTGTSVRVGGSVSETFTYRSR